MNELAGPVGTDVHFLSHFISSFWTIFLVAFIPRGASAIAKANLVG